MWAMIEKFRMLAAGAATHRIMVMGMVAALTAVVALALAAPAPCPGCWRPRPAISPWQIQLQGKLDLSVRARVYEVDGLDVGRRGVAAIHRRGARAVCYLNLGAWERWRSDAARFPPEVLGRPLAGWPGERWLDIRRIDLLAPRVRARLRVCARKGFDGVEADNVDGYANRSGFALTGADQLRYNRFVAREAHRLGLAAGLKNDAGQARKLAPHFDFAVVEQCFRYDECAAYRPFTKAGKAVFAVEYSLPRRSFCDRARRLRFSAVRKRLGLGAWRAACGRRRGP